MKCNLFLSVCVAILFSSCHYLEGERVSGNGNVISKSFPIDGFKGVDVGGAVELYLTQDAAYSVKVETDENLYEYLKVYKDGDILRVRPENNTNLHPTRKIKVYVSAPSYDKIGASGACKVVAENQLMSSSDMNIDFSGACEGELDVKSPSVDIDASGACSLALKGETRNLSIDGSGSTNVKAFNLLSENADVELSGAGDVDVFASVKLDARTSGSASVRYKGNASVSSDVSGAGSVKKAD